MGIKAAGIDSLSVGGIVVDGFDGVAFDVSQIVGIGKPERRGNALAAADKIVGVFLEVVDVIVAFFEGANLGLVTLGEGRGGNDFVYFSIIVG